MGFTRHQSAKRALFEQLVADGVTAVFGNPGTTEQGFMDMLQEYPSIKYYLALHEGVAIAMADAYARVSGKPSLAEVHIAPGLGNAMGMLYNAYIGGSPVVVYAGQSPTSALFQEPYLSGDMVSMARPITKWAAEITRPGDVPQALRRAFKVAMSPPRGPVFLSLPIDVLDAEDEMLIEPTTYIGLGTRPPKDLIDRAAEWLADARSPALAIGDNVGLAGGQADLVALAVLLGMPIFNAFSNGVNAPADHPLYQPRGIPLTSESIRRSLDSHDVLLVVGTSLFPSIFPDPMGPIPEIARVIHVDYDAWELGKNHAGDILIQADPRETLVDLKDVLLEKSDAAMREGWESRRAEVEARLRARRETLARDHHRDWDAVPISPHRLMAEIAAALPSDAVVFDEAITSGGSLEMYLQPKESWRRFRVRGGGIGGGLPGALGAQVAVPDRPVIGIVSEGASMYSITALWTAAHHRLPVTWVVCNNRSYRILKQNLIDYRSSTDKARGFMELDLADPELRFDRIAESMGVPGRRIERPEEIGPALREAIGTPGPVLLDVILDGTP